MPGEMSTPVPEESKLPVKDSDIGAILNDYLAMPGFNNPDSSHAAAQKVLNACTNPVAKRTILGEIERRLKSMETLATPIDSIHSEQLLDLEANIMAMNEMDSSKIN
ncbi:MAG: hypothetical protein NTW50_04970 [Candidatus Berkelbacteria bacterium]|nr:hypothetical protein [Candidatus Berkelbacteria bacterium]